MFNAIMNGIKATLMWIGIAFAAVMGVLMMVLGALALVVVGLIPFILKIAVIGVVLYFVAKFFGLV